MRTLANATHEHGRSAALRRYALAIPRALRPGPAFGRRPRPIETDPHAFVEAWIPYEEHVRELAVLKISGRAYGPEDYRDALESYVQGPIRIKTVPELITGPAVATTSYDPVTGAVTIWVPARLSWWLRQYAIYHELAHVAAGHPPKERRGGTGEIVGTAPAPLRRLARKAPFTPDDLPEGLPRSFVQDPRRFYEDEANLRAEHNMVTSSLGARALEFDRLNQLR